MIRREQPAAGGCDEDSPVCDVTCTVNNKGGSSNIYHLIKSILKINNEGQQFVVVMIFKDITDGSL